MRVRIEYFYASQKFCRAMKTRLYYTGVFFSSSIPCRSCSSASRKIISSALAAV